MAEKVEKKGKKEEASAEEAAPAEGEEKKKGKRKREAAPAAKRPEDENPDFRHLVRLASTDLDGHKRVIIALQGVKGVGKRLASVIADKAAVPRTEKIGNLKDDQIASLSAALENFYESTPAWLFNRQKDYDTGDDTHLIGPDVEIFLREDLNRVKKIRTYKGVRHEAGLRVRGQRTRSNGRTGLTVGVIRKKEAPGGGAAKEEKK